MVPLNAQKLDRLVAPIDPREGEPGEGDMPEKENLQTTLSL